MSLQTTHKSGPAEAADTTRERRLVAPPVDIYENAEGYLVVADLPGVRAEDVDVRFEEGELHLGARRELGERPGLVASEFSDADFRRVFRIPEDVDASRIEAELRAGVLRLRLPKARSLQPRRIAVKTA